jgi:hypothetical protein
VDSLGRKWLRNGYGRLGPLVAQSYVLADTGFAARQFSEYRIAAQKAHESEPTKRSHKSCD